MTELEVPDPLVVGRYTMCLWPKILLPNSDKPVTTEGRNHLTKALGTVIHLLFQAKIETADFQRSECWDDMTECWKPFGIEDFVAMLRYTYSMAISVFRDFEQLPKHYQEADAYLQPLNLMASGDYTGNTMRGMARIIHITATSLNRVVKNLTKKIWASKGGVPTDEKEMPAVPDQVVPAIDLRCLRLWCVLNTKKKRQEFENPQNTLEDMAKILRGLKVIIDPCYKEAGVGFRPSTARKLQKITEGQKNVLDYNVPLMIHICTGMGKVKGKPFYVIHDSTAIGGTQERLSGLPHYYDIRLNARHQHVGNVDVMKWRRALEDLREFDEADKGIEVSDDRLRELKADGLKITCKEHAILMMGRAYVANLAIGLPDTREPPPPTQLQDLDICKAKPLRDCSNHIARPFSTSDATKEAYCCWMCKVTLRYAEPTNPTELHDGLNINASSQTFFRDRSQIPHSCAEVICSKYCVILEQHKRARDKAEKKKEEEKKKKEEEDMKKRREEEQKKRREEEQRRRMEYYQSRARYSHVSRR